MLRLRLTLLALIIMATPASALADDAPDLFGRATKAAAIKEMETGNKLYKQREFERAIDFYKSGQLIEDAPIFLYNLGQCYRLLGDYEQAIWFYERWLSAFNPAKDNPARKAVEKWLSQMRAELEQQARKEPPLEAAPDQGDQSDTSSPEGEGDKADISPPGLTSVSKRPWYTDTLGWGLVGGGVASLAAGGGLLGSAASKRDEANDAVNETQRQKLHDEADKRQRIGFALGGIGAGLVIGGVVSLAIPSRSGESPERRAWFRIDGRSFAVGGRF